MRCNWAFKSPSYFLPVPKQHVRPSSIRAAYAEFQICCVFRAVVHAMPLCLVGRRWCRHDRRNERLRVAVVKREPRALDLHHEAMPRAERVVHVRQRDRVSQRLIRCERLWLVVVVTVSAPEYVGAHH